MVVMVGAEGGDAPGVCSQHPLRDECRQARSYVFTQVVSALEESRPLQERFTRTVPMAAACDRAPGRARSRTPLGITASTS